jgi:heptosyltransferase II
MPSKAVPTRALIVAPQWIGDAVMAQPLLARLAAQGDQITVAALPWVAPVFKAMPEVFAVQEWPFAHGRLDWSKRRHIAASLRGRFDVAYVLPNSIKSALIPWMAGIPKRVGYFGEGRWVLLNSRLSNPAGRPPMVAFYERLGGGIELEHADVPTHIPRLQMPPEVIEAACLAFGVQPGAYWVFAPGAEYGPAKCWPAEHYAALARELAQNHPARPVLLLGSGKEADLCSGIAMGAGAHHGAGICHVLAGKTTLMQALALVAGAAGMVSNDSGLMHVAAAFGIAQVAMFGSTSPEHTPPLNPRAQVLWLKKELELDCAPCFERSCRYGHLRCLTEIAPQRALNALIDSVES